MSSVTRFLKQHAPAIQYLSVPASVANVAYEFVPTGTNVVGNYPPGYVQLVPSGGAVALALAAQGSAGNAPNGLVLRDMGKTIYAPLGNNGTTYGRYRQVQLLAPQVINMAGNGFVGGVAGNTFGVLGVPAGS